MRQATGWTTKDGREIPYPQLGDDHLRNVILMLLRRSPFMREVETLKMALSASLVSGEGASDALELEIAALERTDDLAFLRDYTPHWSGLVAEAERRFGVGVVADLIRLNTPSEEDDRRASASVFLAYARSVEGGSLVARL